MGSHDLLQGFWNEMEARRNEGLQTVYGAYVAYLICQYLSGQETRKQVRQELRDVGEVIMEDTQHGFPGLEEETPEESPIIFGEEKPGDFYFANPRPGSPLDNFQVAVGAIVESLAEYKDQELYQAFKIPMEDGKVAYTFRGKTQDTNPIIQFICQPNPPATFSRAIKMQFV